MGEQETETRATRKGEPGCKSTSASGCKMGRSFDRTTCASVCKRLQRVVPLAHCQRKDDMT
eukprot:4747885-Pyramimonas_sp.AAC.1